MILSYCSFQRGTAFAVVILSLVFCTVAHAGTSPLDPGPHDATLGDVTLHYVIAGRGPLLIVPSPGWGPGSLYLQRGLAPLELHHTLVFLDSRGSGGSSRPADVDRMTIADDADDVEHLRIFFGLARVDLLGHSFGGATAIDYAERYSRTLNHLVLVDAAALDNNQLSKEEEADSMRIREKLSEDPRYASAIKHMKDWTPPPDDAAMAKELAEEAPFQFADPAANLPKFAKSSDGMLPSAWAQRHFFEAIGKRQWHQKQQLNQIRAVTLVINGKQDWLVPQLVAEHLHSGIAGSDLLIIDGSGHFPWIERPNVFFPAVESFLGE
jgi:pimeloyl-ACP methyl ester carboxylesterase